MCTGVPAVASEHDNACMQDLLASEETQLAVVPALAEVLQSRFPQDPELPVGLVQAGSDSKQRLQTVCSQHMGVALYLLDGTDTALAADPARKHSRQRRRCRGGCT